MSEDRNNPIADRAVSEAYKELATERAPASLDEAVLSNAAAPARKSYAQSMLWMRPLAYAATVFLSLAIVIQVVLPPGENESLPAASVSPTANAADVVDAEIAEDDDPLKRLRDQEAREESKIEEFLPLPEDVSAVALADEPAGSVGSADESFGARQDEIEVAEHEVVTVTASRVAQPTAESFAAAAELSESGLQQAGAQTASRSLQASDYDAAVALNASVAQPVCEPDDIVSPDTWAACIERLEENGHVEDARTERQLLTDVFPDFVWPES